MIAVLLSLLVVVWIAGLVLFAVSVRRAPIGFEDDAGFHEVAESIADGPMTAAPLRVS